MHKKLLIGILRESKSKWERRSPILPTHVTHLITKYNMNVLIQPSTIRIIPNHVYEKAGAQISEDLSSANIILGIKEPKLNALIPNKNYLFFSHCHKGQEYNMPMLKFILNHNIRLLDYELITDDLGQRMVMFGSFAGYAGFIDGLHCLGLRMLALGYSSPFLNIGMTYSYPSLNHAKSAMNHVGQLITKSGLPTEFGPIVFTFTGAGNVSKGAQMLFKELPHQYLANPFELHELMRSKTYDRFKVYGIEIKPQHHIVHKSNNTLPWDYKHYLTHPGDYVSNFATQIAPFTTMLVTGHFWDTNFPRLISKQQARQHYDHWKTDKRMITVADISCDIQGALEFTSHATSIDQPYFMYDPIQNIENGCIDEDGIQIMSVDILPTELPLEASQHFGDKLLPYLRDLAAENFKEPTLKRAIIAENGQLTPNHAWLSAKLPSHIGSAKRNQNVVILGSGYVAGPVVDYVLRNPHITAIIATNNINEAKALQAARANLSHRIVIELIHLHSTTVSESLQKVLSKANVVISLVPATLHVPIAKQCIELGVSLVTASYISAGMRELHNDAIKRGVTIMNEVGLDPGIDHLTAKQFIDEVHSQNGRIEEFESWCGGLPSPEYSNNPLGYKFSWSPKGVLMAAMNSAIYLNNGKEIVISSYNLLNNSVPVTCIGKGFAFEGLPNRDSMAYIDAYKLDRKHLKGMFRGTLRYQGYSQLVHCMRLLGLMDPAPLSAAHFGSIPLDRVTWADVMAFLIQQKAAMKTGISIRDQLRAYLQHLGYQLSSKPYVLGITNVLEALDWFDMFGDSRLAFSQANSSTASQSILDATCTRLHELMQYEHGERDLVVMHHRFALRTSQNKRATHAMTLIKYGDPVPTGYSAMARTVALPAAIAAEMILENRIKDYGVLAPLERNVYEPLLRCLHDEGIIFSTKSF